jgi:ABC-type transporter Mla subunit MlaD
MNSGVAGDPGGRGATDRGAGSRSGGRVPAAVGAIPVVGGVLRQADQQAQWMQDLVEQNARLIAALPTTLKSLNDSIERFNQSVNRLERTVTRIEGAANAVTGPFTAVAAAVDPGRLAELPDVLDSLRREAGPALRAATDTQRQVALLQATAEKVIALVSDLPGAGLLRRLSPTRSTSSPAPDA